MNRRDFLLFRKEKQLRVAEISCQRLYMNWLEIEAVARISTVDEALDASTRGEPPLARDVLPMESLLATVERDLQEADVLRVRERDWLRSDALRKGVDSVIDSFVARGGRLES